MASIWQVVLNHLGLNAPLQPTETVIPEKKSRPEGRPPDEFPASKNCKDGVLAILR